MATLQSITTFFLILIPIAAAARGVACLIYIQMEEDPTPYKKRLRNVIFYAVAAECVTGLIHLVVSYLGGGVVF